MNYSATLKDIPSCIFFIWIFYIPEINHLILTGDRLLWHGVFLMVLKQTFLQEKGLHFRLPNVVMHVPNIFLFLVT